MCKIFLIKLNFVEEKLKQNRINNYQTEHLLGEDAEINIRLKGIK